MNSWFQLNLRCRSYDAAQKLYRAIEKHCP